MSSSDLENFYLSVWRVWVPIEQQQQQQQQQAATPVPAERSSVGSAIVSGGGRESTEPPHCPGSHTQRPENALDALLDELQTFSRPASVLSQASSCGPVAATRAPNIAEIGRKGSVDSVCLSLLSTPGQPGALRRLHSYPSSSDTDTSPPIPGPRPAEEVPDGGPPVKPPVPERNAELLQLASARRMPPPPPPRTSSRSPLASPTSPQLPPRNPRGPTVATTTIATTTTGGTLLRRPTRNGAVPSPGGAILLKSFSESNHKPPVGSDSELPLPTGNNMLSTSNSSSCESVNSQEGLQSKRERQEQLEQRHQELLRKQKALQEQYARLQLLQRNASGCATSVPPAPPDLLKKTGSESNLLAKMGLGLSPATTSGSLTSLSGTRVNQTVTASLSLPRSAAGGGNLLVDGSDQAPAVPTTAIGGPINAVTAGTTTTTTTTTNTTTTTTTSKVYETDIL